ncbi:MAG: diguanylate cyclase [Nitrospinae bacterium]|nr:diguanylate cyclase [Nitrospinota bacterium]
MAQDPYKEAAMALTDFLTSSLRQLATFMPDKFAKDKLLLISEQIKRAESPDDIADFKAEYRKVLRQLETSAAKDEKKPGRDSETVPLVSTAAPPARERIVIQTAAPMERPSLRNAEPVDLGAMEEAELLNRFRNLFKKLLNGLKSASSDEKTLRGIDSLIERTPLIKRIDEWEAFEKEVQEVQYNKAFLEDKLTELYKRVFQATMEGFLFLVDKNSIIEKQIQRALEPERVISDPWMLKDLAASAKSFFFSKQQEMFVLGREREKLKSIIVALVRTIQDVAERNHVFMDHVDEYAGALEKAEDLKDIEKIKSGIVLEVGKLRKKTEGLEGEINNIKKKLLTARAAIKSMEEELQKAREESMRDPLTGLYSRAAFEEKLEAALAPGAADRELAGLVLCDLDRFTAARMRYGKPAGDEMLKALASDIKDELRKEDYLARFGDNSFAVISQKRDGAELKGLSERLRETIQSHEFVLKTQTFHLTASVAAIRPSDGESGEPALKRLMELMSSVKSSGGNRSAGPVESVS